MSLTGIVFSLARRASPRRSSPLLLPAFLRRSRRRPQKPDKTDKKDAAVKPALVASFGDWNVFVGQAGKGRICYTLAQPKSREPSSLKRDPGLRLHLRPAGGGRAQRSVVHHGLRHLQRRRG